MKEKFLWYMVSTVTGKEDQVVESLKNRIVSEGVEQSFNQNATSDGPFKIFKKPTISAKEQEKKLNGEPYKVKYINMYSGYIFINMDMTDEAWFVVRNTQYVTGLIGSSGKGAKPTPISEKQIKNSLKQEEKYAKSFEDGEILDPFLIGEIVEIIDGPFKGETGRILELDGPRKQASVELEFFGKKTPTQFDFKSLKSQEK
ncbi:transcription termination/antitermination protein NusG [Mycoplasmopsis columbina]|uniref:Transcription termination/antitermination protein NusG n=1 Tax=Mycoplasmopsis columbina SF7 TaxID=1037410 RepID=F9UJD3_9BACT|nr:transcription termination/antitermination protein NusG [Mycoplasmopsis columbina]EGV00476.1 transcription antitermination protein NusG [Mycoplasmopsis columbina SF7]VEU76614.1 Transcription antitermination protein nusG [Mycoplasmopsis columbina]